MSSEDEQEEQLQKLADEERSIEEANSEILQIMERINSLHIDINDHLFNIQLTKDECEIIGTANEYVQTAPPLLPPNSSTSSGRNSRSSHGSSSSKNGDDALLSKHMIKLDGKVKELHKIIADIEKAIKVSNSLEEKLQTLLSDECNLQAQILQAQNELREYNVATQSNTREVDFIKDQIKERKREMKQMENLQKEANDAYIQLVDRENAFASKGGKLDVEKDIMAKQEELIKIESQIAAVRRRIYEYKEYNQMQSMMVQEQIRNHGDSANWEEEKSSLLATLADLRSQIKDAKLHSKAKSRKSMRTAQSSVSGRLSTEDQDKYGNLMRKWGPLQDAKEADGDIDELWDQVQEPRLKLTRLLEKNHRRQKELAQKKKALERSVAKFHGTENKHFENAVERHENFLAEEDRLIKKIKEMKIKVAQARLSK